MDKVEEAKYSVDVEGLPLFYMDADNPSQVKVALRKLLRKASSIDSVERVNDAKIRQDFKQRARDTETKSVTENKAMERAKALIKRERQADKIKHDQMLDRARLRDTQRKNRSTVVEKVLGNIGSEMFPDIERMLDKTLNRKRYAYAIRLFLDLRKKNPGKARQNLLRAAKAADVDVRTLDRLFRDYAKQGKYPKHLVNYHPTFVENKTYHKGLSKSTKAKREAQFKKQAKMDDNNPAAYKPAPGDKTAKTKLSKHTLKYREMYGEEVIAESTKEGLKKKAEKSGISYGILKKVYDRGVAAWRTGHRPGTTPSQWGYARVNSFITGGKTRRTADADLWKQVRK